MRVKWAYSVNVTLRILSLVVTLEVKSYRQGKSAKTYLFVQDSD